MSHVKKSRLKHKYDALLATGETSDILHPCHILDVDSPTANADIRYTDFKGDTSQADAILGMFVIEIKPFIAVALEHHPNIEHDVLLLDRSAGYIIFTFHGSRYLWGDCSPLVIT